MNAKLMLVSAALGAGMLSGCDRNKPVVDVPSQTSSQAPASPAGVLAPAATMSQTPATAAERKAGMAPIQGQVDPKEPAQRRAFEDSKR